MSLTIGYCHAGQVPHEFTQSLVGLCLDDHGREHPRFLNGMATIAVQSGPRIAWARNEIVRTFLEATNSEWLLMVDSDMVFGPDALNLLLEVAHPSRTPIVGGLCFGGGRSGIMFPTLYRLRTPTEENPEVVEIIEDYPRDALVKVDATGAAFLLMHRGALKRIGERFEATTYPWFIEGWTYKGVQFGEDWAFCVRARELNIPIHVLTAAKVGHVKSMVLDESAYEPYLALKREVGEEQIKQEHRQRLHLPAPRELEVV